MFFAKSVFSVSLIFSNPHLEQSEWNKYSLHFCLVWPLTAWPIHADGLCSLKYWQWPPSITFCHEFLNNAQPSLNSNKCPRQNPNTALTNAAPQPDSCTFERVCACVCKIVFIYLLVVSEFCLGPSSHVIALLIVLWLKIFTLRSTQRPHYSRQTNPAFQFDKESENPFTSPLRHTDVPRLRPHKLGVQRFNRCNLQPNKNKFSDLQVAARRWQAEPAADEWDRFQVRQTIIGSLSERGGTDFCQTTSTFAARSSPSATFDCIVSQ